MRIITYDCDVFAHAYLVKTYKKRCTTYRKNGRCFVEEEKNATEQDL